MNRNFLYSFWRAFEKFLYQLAICHSLGDMISGANHEIDSELANIANQ